MHTCIDCGRPFATPEARKACELRHEQNHEEHP
jgi:hypothetical protein